MRPEDLGADASWAARSADRAPAAQRARVRSVERGEQILQAARRLIAQQGTNFTTQELVREAGVAIQTFYTHFGGKDQVLLAVIGDLISQSCRNLAVRGAALSDPLARLHFYVTSVLGTVGRSAEAGVPSGFVTGEHFRMHQLYPAELAEATRPFVDLLLPEISAAKDAGLVSTPHPEYDAWLVSQLLTTLFHHYDHAPSDLSAEEISERVWSFCLRALGGASDVVSR